MNLKDFKWKRIFRWIGAGLILVLLACGAYYLNIALQIGKVERQYREYAARHADAQHQVDAMVQSVGGTQSPSAGLHPSQSKEWLAPGDFVDSINGRSIPQEYLFMGTLFKGTQQSFDVWLTQTYPEVAGKDGLTSQAGLPMAIELNIKKKMTLYKAESTRCKAERGLSEKQARFRQALPGMLSAVRQYLLETPGKVMAAGAVNPGPYSKWYFPSVDELIPLALLDETLRGDAQRDQLFLNYLKLLCMMRLQVFPRELSLKNIREIAIATANRKPLSDATLAEAEQILKNARWDNRQLDSLRAAHLARLNARDYYSYDPYYSLILLELKNKHFSFYLQQQQRSSGKWFRTAFNWGTDPLISLNMKRSGLAWASGTLDDYAGNYSKLHHLVDRYMRNLVFGALPPDLAGSNPDPAVNEDIDVTRLVLAALRYQRENGRMPSRIEELAGRWLDESFNPSSRSCWGIRQVAGNPVFFHLRCETLPSWLIARAKKKKEILKYFQIQSNTWGTADGDIIKPLKKMKEAGVVTARCCWLDQEEIDSHQLDELLKPAGELSGPVNESGKDLVGAEKIPPGSAGGDQGTMRR